MVKKLKNPYSKIEKTLTIATIALVIFASVAAINSFYTNQRFIYALWRDVPLYLNYVFILGGGFAAGYFLTAKGDKHSKLLTASVASLLTMAIYMLSAVAFTIVHSLFGYLPVELESGLYGDMPLICAIITAITVLLLQKRTKHTEPTSALKWTFIALYLGYSLYSLGWRVYYELFPTEYDAAHPDPIWLNVAAYLLNPIVIMIVTFIALSKVKGVGTRLFYASMLTAIVDYFTLSLWSFRTDASLESTNNFQVIVAVVSLVFITLFVWKVRRDAIQTKS